MFYFIPSDGIEASGLFCAVSILLNKMKAEKIADVFQAVKRVRMGRHDMIQNLVGMIGGMVLLLLF